VNDSVIIFDRISTNISKNNSSVKAKSSLYEIICTSTSQTLSRTIVTSLTTLFSVVAIILFAGRPVAGFGYTTLFGILLGTYSSIFISAPVLFWLKRFDKSLQL
jgi:preprotein translocase subunit SecF